jgi:hypothetical protein
MTKYHPTEIGPKPCKANIGSCPVGGTHFSDLLQFKKNLKQDSKKNSEQVKE